MNKTNWPRLTNWEDVSGYITPRIREINSNNPESYGTYVYHYAGGPLFEEVDRVLINQGRHTLDVIGTDGSVRNAEDVERITLHFFTKQEIEQSIPLSGAGESFEDAILHFPDKQKLDLLFFKDAFWGLPRKDEVYQYAPPLPRYEVQRDHMRVVLLMDPVRKRYLISYSPPEYDGIHSMVLDYFEYKFNMFMFYKIAVRDGIQFFAKHGDRSNRNDVQKFQLLFNHEQYFFSDHAKVVRISGKRQRRFVRDFLEFMNAYLVCDLYGSSSIQKNETKKEEGLMDYYKGVRIYSMPLFDLVICFDKRPFMINDPELTLAGVSMYYFPHARRRQRAKWYLHDIVYEGNK